jgi:hypothetical protein
LPQLQGLRVRETSSSNKWIVPCYTPYRWIDCLVRSTACTQPRSRAERGRERRVNLMWTEVQSRRIEAENELFRSHDGDLILTSDRVRFYDGPLSTTSIFLEHICSVRVAPRGYRMMLILSMACFLAAGMDLSMIFRPTRALDTARYRPRATICAVLGAMMALCYSVTRHQTVTIASAADQIRWSPRSLSTREILRVVASLEAAKENRLKQIIKPPLYPTTFSQALGRPARSNGYWQIFERG